MPKHVILSTSQALLCLFTVHRLMSLHQPTHYTHALSLLVDTDHLLNPLIMTLLRLNYSIYYIKGVIMRKLFFLSTFLIRPSQCATKRKEVEILGQLQKSFNMMRYHNTLFMVTLILTYDLPQKQG